MTYDIAKAMGANVTYGWLITQLVSGGPAVKARLKGGTKQVLIAGKYVTVNGDIIIAINGIRISSIDALSAYLEENTSPGQIIEVIIVRENQIMNVAVTLGTHP